MTKYQIDEIEKAEKDNEFKTFPNIRVKFAGTENQSKWFWVNEGQLKKFKEILKD